MIMLEGGENFQGLSSFKEKAGPLKKEKLMPFPAVAIREEKGIHLMSLMLKAYDPEWGNESHKLASLSKEYFAKHPLSGGIRKSLDDLKALAEIGEEGIDEETFFNIALSYGHPERIGEISEVFLKHDKEIKNADGLQKNILDLMQDFEKELSREPEFSDLKNEFDTETEKDIGKRKDVLEMKKTELEKVWNFFRPENENAKANEVVILPTEQLCKEGSGMGFGVGEKIIVRVPLKDFTESNQWIHEVLHGIINPITDKLFERLTEKQKQIIVQFSSNRIKMHYGNNAATLLNESFIRTYVNFFEKGLGQFTHDFFKKYLDSASEEEFREGLRYKEFRFTLDSMGIKTLKGLYENSKEFFERYEKDILGNAIYRFYENYKKCIENSKDVTFEDYVLKEFPEFLKGVGHNE